MKKSSLTSPAVYVLILINALVVAFIVDFVEHKVIGSYSSYYIVQSVQPDLFTANAKD